LEKGFHTWKFKILKSTEKMDVGVVSPNHTSHFQTSLPTCWGLRNDGRCYYGGKESTGVCFGEGDIITFYLDFGDNSLVISINDISLPFAFNDVIGPVHIAFCGLTGAAVEILDDLI
jgi:hypothetical protein